MLEPLLSRLQNHITQMDPHQQERQGGKLMIEAAREIEKLNKDYNALHSQVSGYLHGDEWDHWQELNAAKFQKHG